MLAAVLTLAAALRLPAIKYPYEHIDEEIGVTVARHVVTAPTLDTNWDHVPMDAWWTTPQFNFSAYNLTGAVVLGMTGAAEAADPAEAKRILRWFSALLGLAAVALTFVIGRRMFDETVGLSAAALAAVNPLLVHDSLYVRPETFVTTLMLVYLLLLESPRAQRWPRLFMAALVGGILVATKISLLAVIPILFLPYVSPQDENAGGLKAYISLAIQELPHRLPVAALGLCLGFVAGAPYALVDFNDYLTGLSALHVQYTSGNWPNGVSDGSIAQRLSYALRFFVATAGGLMVGAAFLGAALTAFDRRLRLFLVFLCALVIAVRFGSYAAFFERNFSHIVPTFLVFAAFLLVRLLRGIRLGPFGRAAILAGLVLLVAAPAARTSAKLVRVSAPGVDEIEKGMPRNEGHIGDNGVSMRVFAAFLTWLQEKTAPVFVFATANQIDLLAPEVLRKGRFDEIFFVDLPTAPERREILEIHLKKIGRAPDDLTLDELVRLSGEESLGEGVSLSGAEIEAWVNESLIHSFYRGKLVEGETPTLTLEDFRTIISRSNPLARIRREEIQKMRAWAKSHALNASILNQPASDNSEGIRLPSGRKISP